MTSSHASDVLKPAVKQERRTRTTMAAFVLGIPLAAAILCFLQFGPYRDSVAVRYIKHPAEQVEVVMFSMAVGALIAKLVAYRRERRACRLTFLPPWDGTPAALRKELRE